MRRKLKDWYTDNHGDEREKRVKEVFSKWYKRNLVYVYIITNVCLIDNNIIALYFHD